MGATELDLFELLQKHYSALYPDEDAIEDFDETCKNDTSEECKERVLEYLRTNQSIEHEDIFFIKTFTKVAKHIFKAEPDCFDGLIERFYDYHLQGIIKIQNKSNWPSHEKMHVMRAHMHGHAADIAAHIFYLLKNKSDVPINEKLRWANESYNNEAMAISIGDQNPSHICIRHDYAGKISKRVVDFLDEINAPYEKKILWLERVYLHKDIAAEMSFDIGFKDAGIKYSNSSKAADLIVKLIKDRKDISLDKKIEWTHKLYNGNIKAAEVTEQYESLFAAYKYHDAAMSCTTLYELTKIPYHLNEGYRLLLLSAKMASNKFPGFSAAQENNAGDFASRLYVITENEKWNKKARNHYQKYVSHYASNKSSIILSRSRSRRKSSVDKTKKKIKDSR